MANDPDVLVVGGGIVGLFCAYFLKRAGARVTVVEAATISDPIASSYGNTGFVAHGGAPLAGPGAYTRGLRSWLRPDGNLAWRPGGNANIRTWLRHYRRACTASEWRRCRNLLVDMKSRSIEILYALDGPAADAVTPADVLIAYRSEAGFATARTLAARGAAPMRALAPDELAALEPDARFAISGAILHTGAAFLHAPAFTTALARELAIMGVDIREGAEVRGFDLNGSTIAKVRTVRGDIRPYEVVIAAGTWSVACARLLGERLAVAPVQGHSITVATPPGAPRHPVLLSEGTVAVRPLGDRLRFAGSLVLTGRQQVSARRVRAILDTVRRHLPHMEIPADREVWTGYRPCTPDSLPLIGRVPAYANVSIATGHGHVGMGLAPAGGRLLAQIVLGERPEMDVTPFRVDRFEPGRAKLRSGGRHGVSSGGRHGVRRG